MIDLLVCGSGPLPALLLERVSWRMGARGERAVALWADPAPAPESVPERPAPEDGRVAYDALFEEIARSRAATAAPSGEEEWLPLDQVLQELVQGAELQDGLLFRAPESFPAKTRVKRAWSRFLLRDPDEANPFRLPPGSLVALKGGWARLPERLASKHSDERLSGTRAESVVPGGEGAERFFRAVLADSSGARRTVEARLVVAAGEPVPGAPLELLPPEGTGLPEAARAADALGLRLGELLSLER